MTVSDPNAPNPTNLNASAEETSVEKAVLTDDHQTAEAELSREIVRSAHPLQPPTRKVIVCPDQPIGGDYKCYVITLPPQG